MDIIDRQWQRDKQTDKRQTSADRKDKNVRRVHSFTDFSIQFIRFNPSYKRASVAWFIPLQQEFLVYGIRLQQPIRPRSLSPYLPTIISYPTQCPPYRHKRFITWKQLFFFLSVKLSVKLSVYLSNYLSNYLSVCMSVCMYTYRPMSDNNTLIHPQNVHLIWFMSSTSPLNCALCLHKWWSGKFKYRIYSTAQILSPVP